MWTDLRGQSRNGNRVLSCNQYRDPASVLPVLLELGEEKQGPSDVKSGLESSSLIQKYNMSKNASSYQNKCMPIAK